MRQVSSAFKSRLYVDDYRNYIEDVYVYLADGTTLHLTNQNLWGYGLKVDESVSQDNSLDIGSAIINECDISIENLQGTYNQYNFSNAKVVPYVGLLLANNTTESVKMGEYYVYEAKHNISCITLVCYDVMLKFDKLISNSNLSYPATLTQIVNDACSVCGVTLKTGASLNHGTYSVKTKPDGTSVTFRNLLSWACQISGQNATITVDGELDFVWYDATGLSNIINGQTVATAHDIPSTFGAPTVGLEDTIVTQINVNEKIKNQDGNDEIVSYKRGVNGYTISIENNELVQDGKAEDIAQWLYNDLYGFRFRKANFSTLSDPSIQAGDIAKLHDRKGNYFAIIVSSTKFQVGTQQTITSSASEPERTSVSRTTQGIKNYVGMMRDMAAERKARSDADTAVLDIVEANYVTTTYLEANYINADTIDARFIQSDTVLTNLVLAERARIDSIETNDLTAINASINTLDAASANITNLLSGNIGTGQLQTITLTGVNTTVQSAFADKIIANYAAVQNLAAGNINTSLVTISSNDGGMVITGNTQQFKDASGNVRIQIGKDGQGVYSFGIYDASGNPLWYNDGITVNGIPNGTIVDSKVATVSGAYTGISADKLNISSVKGAIEEGGFSSSLIYFDDTQQTLNQVYTQMSSDITTASNAATTADNKATSAIGQISSLREMISEIDTLESMSVILTNDAHVVHTYNDGSGGVYTDAKTQVVVMIGETDVTSQAYITYTPSSSVTGTWNNTLKTYQVTALSDMNGYVDFNVTYGAVVRFLTTRAGNQFVTRSGKKLKLPSGAAHMSKRFSISKAPDGQIGTSYNLTASTLCITKSSTGTLSPSTVTFSATKNSGSATTIYAGIFMIEETSNWSSYTTTYTSSTPESSKVYTPSAATIKGIRCTLKDLNGQALDVQTVTLIADADGMQTQITAATEGVQSLTNRMGVVETGINGLSVSLGETNQTLQGVTDGNLLFQTPFTWSNNNQTANFTAVIYKAGVNVTANYPARWFEWFIRSEDKDKRIAIGKTCQVNKSECGYGATIVGRFQTFNLLYLLTRSGKNFTTRSGNKMTIWKP